MTKQLSMLDQPTETLAYPPNFIERVALRKLPDGYWAYRFEALDYTAKPPTIFRITGGKPRTLKSGPRKGSLTVESGTSVEVYVTRAEALAEEQAYEDETGKCGACVDGKVRRFSEFVDCRRCGGTGRAVVKKVPT